jgi:pyruvate/2-oxoglutarate dehydrogenase complex dihydrolipoamide acyltransferase (E2) component
MRKPVLTPEIGAPAVLSVWFVRPGDPVYEGDRLVELLIGDATIDVSAPVAGVFVEKKAWPDQPVTAGQVLGYIEENN